MASQTISLGVPTRVPAIPPPLPSAPDRYEFSISAGSRPEIDAALLAPGVPSAFLESFRMWTDTPAHSIETLRNRVQLNLTDTQTGGASTTEELSEAFEENLTALTLSRSGDNDTIVVRGPNAAGVVFADATEPYQWQPPAGEDGSAIYDYIAERPGDTYSLTLDDGVAPPTTVTAAAGGDETIPSGGTADLDGSGSTVTNPSGTTAYAWAIQSGSGGSLTDANSETATFNGPTLPAGGADRTFVVRLTVTNDGVSDTDDKTITVEAPAAPPTTVTADAGDDKTVDSGGTVQLDGSAAVENGVGETTYAWTRSPLSPNGGGSLNDASIATPIFTAPSLTPGSADAAIWWELVATNNGVSSIASRVVVTVTAPPAPASVTNTAITSTPQALSDTYGLGEIIEFSVTWDEAVTVTGTPRFPMNLGQSPSGGPEYADYLRGSGSTTLVFGWDVAATDQDTNGVFFYGDTDSQNRGDIDLNGGTIRNAGGVDADLVTLNRGTKSGHKVDGSLLPPTASGSARAGVPTASASAEAIIPQASGSAAAGSPSATAKTEAPTASGVAEAGTPSATVTLFEPGAPATGSATAGAPSATARAEPGDAAGSASAGAPSANASVAASTPSAEASAIAGAPSATAGVENLLLSAFDQSGLTVDCLAVLAKNVDGDYIFRAAGRGGSDTPIEGELGYGDGADVVSGIRLVGNNGIRLHGSEMSTYFGVGGAGRGLSLHFRVGSTVQTAAIETAFLSAGGGFLNLNVSAALYSLLDGMPDGAQFIFGLAEPVEMTVVTASGSATAGSPQASATASAGEGKGSAHAGTPSAIGAAEAGQAKASASAGSPTATARTSGADAKGSATAGAPSATADAEAGPETASGAATAGAPSATADAESTGAEPAVSDDPGPVLPKLQNRTYSAGMSVTEVLPIANGGTGALTYSLTGAVTGLAFASGTRRLTGQPTTIGATLMTYTVEDEDGESMSRTFWIVVGPASGPPSLVLPPVADRVYFVGDQVEETLPRARGGTGVKAYSMVGNPLPAGFSYAGSRLLSGTARTEGEIVVTHRVQDAANVQRDRQFKIKIHDLRKPMPHPNTGAVESRIALLIEPVGSPGNARYRQGFAWWNGANQLTLGGVTYEPGEILGLSDYAIDMQSSEPLTVFLEGADELFETWLIRGGSSRNATVTFLLRIDDGAWEDDIKYIGRVGYVGQDEDSGRWSLEVDSEIYIPSQAGVTRTSDEAQRAVYSTDKIYKDLKTLAGGNKRVWPG